MHVPLPTWMSRAFAMEHFELPLIFEQPDSDEFCESTAMQTFAPNFNNKKPSFSLNASISTRNDVTRVCDPTRRFLYHSNLTSTTRITERKKHKPGSKKKPHFSKIKVNFICRPVELSRRRLMFSFPRRMPLMITNFVNFLMSISLLGFLFIAGWCHGRSPRVTFRR
jgi:hypothetical protein